ncbi:MAG: HAD family hydrolase [Sulfurospirillum cavolei]|nr:HAD family hydrolase [Sulfurospirillum cavolei]
MRIKVVVFDLDDTLYEEITYVYSGFKAVANALSQEHALSFEALFGTLKETLHVKGRGQIFDDLLRHYGLYTKARVQHCVSLYRLHTPTITLLPEAQALLRELQHKQIPVYMVTDGNKIVQNRKIEALHVKPFVKKVFITHRYGKMHAKPSPYCFEKIATLENITPQEIVYIADNPHKDFIGIKPLGFQTIRIKQGMFKEMETHSAYNAHHTIKHIKELSPLLKLLCNKVLT